MSVKDIDLGWGKILADMEKLDATYAKVGIQTTAGSVPGNSSMNMATLGAIHEYGGSKIPQRPFIRQGLESGMSKIKSISDSVAGRVLDGTISTRNALELVGMAGESAIKDNMSSGNFTPNAPSTIKKKKSDTPLIDTGHLRQSITTVVE